MAATQYVALVVVLSALCMIQVPVWGLDQASP
jgi:hypothetical protein